jgi:hypothetical protein
VFTDTTAIANRLPHPEISTALRAGWYARSAYPGPVGELVARELIAYVDTDVRVTSSALVRRVLEDVLRLPGAPRPHPDYRKPTRPTLTTHFITSSRDRPANPPRDIT